MSVVLAGGNAAFTYVTIYKRNILPGTEGRRGWRSPMIEDRAGVLACRACAVQGVAETSTRSHLEIDKRLSPVPLLFL
jgi:hypothetical protein